MSVVSCSAAFCYKLVTLRLRLRKSYELSWADLLEKPLVNHNQFLDMIGVIKCRNIR
jgi:hypothetical protein